MTQIHHVNNPFTAADIEVGLMALVAWAGSPLNASRYLKSSGKLDISPYSLNNWKQIHSIRYMEIRDEHSARMESELAHEMRDVAMLAVQAERAAVQAAHESLENGTEKDPARAAANLARVAQSSTDKLLSLTGRPTQITETRDLEVILRSLAAKGVVRIPQAAESTEESTVEGEDG